MTAYYQHKETKAIISEKEYLNLKDKYIKKAIKARMPELRKNAEQKFWKNYKRSKYLEAEIFTPGITEFDRDQYLKVESVKVKWKAEEEFYSSYDFIGYKETIEKE